MKSIKNFMIFSLLLGMTSTSVSCAVSSDLDVVPVLEDDIDSDSDSDSDIESKQEAVLGESIQHFEDQLFVIIEGNINYLVKRFRLKRMDRVRGTREKSINNKLLKAVFEFIEKFFSPEKIHELHSGVEKICLHEEEMRELDAFEDGMASDLALVRDQLRASYQTKIPKYVNSNNSTIKKMLEFVWTFFTRQEMDFVEKVLAKYHFDEAVQKLRLAEQKALSQASPKCQKVSLVRQTPPLSSSASCSPVALASPGVFRTLSTLSLVSRIPGPVQRSTSDPASYPTLQLGAAPSPTRLVSVEPSPTGSTFPLGATEPLQRSESLIPFLSPVSSPTAQKLSPTDSMVFDLTTPIGAPIGSVD